MVTFGWLGRGKNAATEFNKCKLMPYASDGARKSVAAALRNYTKGPQRTSASSFSHSAFPPAQSDCDQTNATSYNHRRA
jgi:hypothetical protein